MGTFFSHDVTFLEIRGRRGARFLYSPTFSSFRRRLKPFLFQQSYPDIVI